MLFLPVGLAAEAVADEFALELVVQEAVVDELALGPAVVEDVVLEAVGEGLDLVTVVVAEDELAVAWGAAVELDVAELVPVSTVGVVAQNKLVLVAEAAVDVLVLGVGPVEPETDEEFQLELVETVEVVPLM